MSSGVMSQTKLEALQGCLRQQAELSDYLVHSGELSEEQLSETLGLKDGVPSIYLDPGDISPQVARVLPAEAQAEARIIPFRVDRGRLLIAGPQSLESSVLQALRRYTKLEIEFHLVTWRNFEELRRMIA